jgi:phosphoglycerate dehydrogenase-like enzyme
MADPIEVLITLPFSDSLIARLREQSPHVKIVNVKARRPEDIPDNIWEQVEVLYTNHVLPNPEQAPKLRWIQFHWTGVDHALGEPIFNKPDLIATTLSGASASQMAEYVVMMLLALGHQLPDLIAGQKRNEWPMDRWDRFRPRELRNSTVGIVGYGSIGRQVARLLQPFGARLLATKRDVMHPADDGYIPEGWGDPNGDFVLRLYPPTALRSMVKECDFVLVTVPLTAETRDLIDADVLAAMKPNAFIIDVSRGGVINQPALIIALRDRKIGGAALDVFVEEPLPEDNPLWKLPNVVLTPHISGISPYYDERAMQLFSENLSRYQDEKPLFNRIDPDLGY